MSFHVVVVETYEMYVGVFVCPAKVYSEQTVAIGTLPVACSHEFFSFSVTPPVNLNKTVLRFVAYNNLVIIIGVSSLHTFFHRFDS